MAPIPHPASRIPLKFPRETRWKPARDATTRPRHGDGCCDCAVTTTMLSSFSAAVNPALGRPLPVNFYLGRRGGDDLFLRELASTDFFFSFLRQARAPVNYDPVTPLIVMPLRLERRRRRCDAMRCAWEAGAAPPKRVPGGRQGGGRERRSEQKRPSTLGRTIPCGRLQDHW